MTGASIWSMLRKIWKHIPALAIRAVGLPPNDSTPAVGPLHDRADNRFRTRSRAFDTAGNSFGNEPIARRSQISDLFRDGNRQVVLATGRVLHVLDHRGRDRLEFTLYILGLLLTTSRVLIGQRW
jgi:hypothetical protein